MKIKPFYLWAAVERDGRVVALKTNRVSAREFVRDWSNEVMPMYDRGNDYGMVMAVFGPLRVQRVRVTE